MLSRAFYFIPYFGRLGTITPMARKLLPRHRGKFKSFVFNFIDFYSLRHNHSLILKFYYNSSAFLTKACTVWFW